MCSNLPHELPDAQPSTRIVALQRNAPKAQFYQRMRPGEPSARWSCGREGCVDLVPGQLPPCSRPQISQLDTAEGDAFQRRDFVTARAAQPADLPVLSSR